jgi:hypothetical protein
MIHDGDGRIRDFEGKSVTQRSIGPSQIRHLMMAPHASEPESHSSDPGTVNGTTKSVGICLWNTVLPQHRRQPTDAFSRCSVDWSCSGVEQTDRIPPAADMPRQQLRQVAGDGVWVRTWRRGPLSGSQWRKCESCPQESWRSTRCFGKTRSSLKQHWPGTLGN